MIDVVNYPRLEPLGDRAILVVVGDGVDAATNAAARRLHARLAARIDDAELEWVVGMASVALITPSPLALPDLKRRVEHLLGSFADTEGGEPTSAGPDGRLVELAVHYGDADGPDLDAVAAHAGLDCAATIAAHAGGDYTVACIGFQPGFPYLLGLDPRLAMPRRAEPRSAVAAGSVGIGGAQTGIYPARSPGGWQLIGRVTERLFDPRRSPASLLTVGDRVRFRAVESFVHCGEHDDGARPDDRTVTAAAARVVEVLHPGSQTTVQDTGRPGHRAIGVTPGGAADPAALALANVLVGNAPDAAGLEVLLRGPRLRFSDARVVAWCGAAEATVRVGELSIPPGRPASIPAGAELEIGSLRNGFRLWFAIGGGVELPRVLGSRGTDLRGGFGGLAGRALRSGDPLPLGVARGARGRRGEQATPELLGYGSRPSPVPGRGTAVELRVLAGSHAVALDDAGCELLQETTWTVNADSDRMGLRLSGATLTLDGVGELPSAAVLPGTVQLPPSGQPVILGVDGQTLGGYPRVAHVIDADRARLAQLGPGSRVRLRYISVGEAEELERAARRERTRALEGARQVAALEFEP